MGIRKKSGLFSVFHSHSILDFGKIVNKRFVAFCFQGDVPVYKKAASCVEAAV